ncbi:DNA segregation ATPase FtsK/SpoIIIE, S-DNA-T family [Pseudonocardia ammonioxydans]|uniref:DNA segregation ATPase FtsK/SpoIIIE, S-DNA-T family n=1 Tax=Pseudonocardia ammonioxydans TaxID=260086 RepID=A0A1I5HY73_PSUAM|nr:FtsK/SpoIIIE domain-containing protein [Pseudonocardia ammonioxydans]SFO52751.1 DNA segregation ATPase FtsK/SpoIIIE, S-DNA-T family [Pseudonocardia ammonioxydans]
MSLFTRNRRPFRDREGEAMVEQLLIAWTRACEGAELVRTVDTVTGPTVIPPKLVDITLGPPTVLIAELQPGMIPADVVALGPRIAPHMNAYGIRVEPIGHRHVRVTLIADDPLDTLVELRAGRGVLLGADEAGAAIRTEPADLPHAIVQGTTRSGKSVWTYSLLAQLVARDDVLIAGCDPTGLLFRPFAATRHNEWQSSGLADVDAHEKALRRVVEAMDDRIRELPDDRDTLDVTPARPLLVVVLEEYPGLLRVLDAGKSRGDDPGARVRALVSRLLAEGHKAGIRVVILAQRAEASVVGALERAQCSLRISFRVDSRTSCELLHPGTDPAIADAHTTALPGVALMSRPGHNLTRFRAPFLGGYREYVHAIRDAS